MTVCAKCSHVRVILPQYVLKGGIMRALDVANYFIANYGGGTEMTNLKLNKLVYFAQAVSLKQYGVPLFSDEIQAWSYGPVEPEVY